MHFSVLSLIAASAQPIFRWDPSGTAGLQEGAGTWDAATTAAWTADNGASNVIWNSANVARFGGASSGSAGTVTVSGTVSCAGMKHFLPFSGQYTFTGGTNITLASATVDVDSGATPNIGTPINGTAGLTKIGDGTLILTGAKTYTGGTVVSVGLLQLGDGITNHTMNGNYVISSGATMLWLRTNTASPDWPSISGAGSFTINTTRANSGTLNAWTSNAALPVGFTGVFTIGRGRVIAATDGGLGSASLVVVESGAMLYTNGSGVTYTKNLSLAGVGYGDTFASALGLVSSDHTHSGNILLASSANISGSTGLTGTLSGVISGANTSHVTFGTVGGAGTLLLTGVNTYSGDTVVAQGTVKISGSGSLGAGNYAGGISGGGSFTYASSANQTLSGVVSGTLAVRKDTSASSVLTITGTNTFTGVLTLVAGTISIPSITNGGASGPIGAATTAASNMIFGNATMLYTGSGHSTDRNFTISAGGGAIIESSGSGALTWSGAPTFTGAFPLTLGGTYTGANTFSGVIGGAGSGSVVKTGAGHWVLSGTNTYTGVTTINGGTLGVTVLANGGSNSNIGAATTAASNLILASGATLVYTGSGHSTNRGFTMQSGGGVIDGSGSGNLTWAGNPTASTACSLLLVGSRSGNVFSGVIGSGANIELLKSGTGTWTLTGANTYTGATSVNDGTLIISSAAGLGTGAVAVNSGGTLTYTVDTTGVRTVTVNTGGVVNKGGFLHATTVFINNGGTINA